MKLSKLLDIKRARMAREATATLEAITRFERWLRKYGLDKVMEENASGVSCFMTYEWDRDNTVEDWDGRPLGVERYTDAFQASIRIDAGVKPLVIQALLRSATDHDLEWEKRVTLSYHKPRGGDIPYAEEVWSTATVVVDADVWWRDSVDIVFYWVPEIGEQLTPTCTVERVEETTTKTTRSVMSVCNLEKNGEG